MAVFEIDSENSLYHEHQPPERPGAPTFVFTNPLTGSTASWEAAVAPALRAQGFGTLLWNFRGQTDSDFGAEVEITDTLIADDLKMLVEALSPSRPIHVGLSIGGLYAAKAILNGAAADGLVLLNMLREIGPRLQWVNDAMAKLSAHGGIQMFMDATFPLVVNPEYAVAARPNFLKGGYAPPDPAHGHMNLMRNAPSTDWDIDYERLTLPVLSISGLHDRVFFDAEVVDRLYARLPDARREDWDDAGHLLPMERPERLAEHLAGFGAELEAR